MFKLLLMLVVLGAAGALGWMLFLPGWFAAQLRNRTGFTVEVRSLVVNPFTGLIDVRGLVLGNPASFPTRDFLELREFRAQADLGTLWSDRPVFEAVTLDIAKITLVKAANGRTNAEALQQGPVPAARKVPKFLIRRLDLRMDRLVTVDQAGPRPFEHQAEVNVRGTYRDVTDLRPLVSTDVWQALVPLGGALEGLMPDELGQALGGAAKEAAKAGAERLRQLEEHTEGNVKGFIESLEETKKP